MKKLTTIFTLLALVAFTSCDELDIPIALQTSTLTVSFHFNTFNEGESMTRALSNADIYNEFYNAICDGRLVAPSYDLTLTEVNTGKSFQLQGLWNEQIEAEIGMGIYTVKGTSTAEGKYIQEKCSIVIDEANVVIDHENATISLTANYDCALVIFNDESIASIVNHTEGYDQELFRFSPYIYAFVNDKIWDGVSESYLLATRQNGSQFTIPTMEQPYDKGKYYVYGSDNTQYFESGFILPDMEEGEIIDQPSNKGDEVNMFGEGTLAFLKAIVDGNMLGDQTPTITDWTDLSQVVFPGITAEMIDNKLEIVYIDGAPFTDLPEVMNLTELVRINCNNQAGLNGKMLPQAWNTPKLEYCNFAWCGMTGTIPEGLASTTPELHTIFMSNNKFYGALPHTWASGVNGGTGKLECAIFANHHNKTTSQTLPIVTENDNPGLGYIVPATFDVKLNKWVNDDPSQGHENPSRDLTQIKLGGVFEQNYIGFEKGWGQERYVKYGGGADDDLSTWSDHRLLIDEWAWYFSNLGYTDRCMPIPQVMLDWDQAAADAYTAEAALMWGTTAQ